MRWVKKPSGLMTCGGVRTWCRDLDPTNVYFCLSSRRRSSVSPPKMRIQVKDSTMVRPAHPTPRRLLWTSNLDLVVRRSHVLLVCFFRTDGSPNFFDAGLLKEALSKVLVPFYPMAARSRLDQTRRPVIHCDAQGVLFVEAEDGSTSLDDLGDFVPRPEFHQLVPEACHADDDLSGEHPLFLLQLTRFRCGGVSLGLAFHHILGDGTSLGQFMHTWADMSRGGTATPPFHDRTALAARDPPTPCFPHLEYAEPPSLASGPAGADSPSESVTAIFRLSAADLEVLKSQANEGDPPGRYSTYEAVAAHVWRCACEARALPSGQETLMRTSVNGRPRLRPPLPPGYFGNAIFTTVAAGAAGELRGNPLAVAAGRVREALARMDDGYMRSALDHLEKRPDLPSLARGARTFRSPNIGLTSGVNLQLSDFDFGWGKPVFMGPAELPFEGFGYLLPSPAAGDERSLSVVIRLQREAMERWKNVFYDFRWWRNSRQRSKL